MSGEWAATLTGRTMARFAPSSLAISAAGLDRGALAGDDDLAGRVAVGDDERAVRGRRATELGESGVVEADDRGHRAVAALAGGLHQLAAAPDEADAVGERDDAGRDQRAVLAHRVAGREGRAAAATPPVASTRSRSASRMAIEVGEDRRLGVARSGRARSAGPSQASVLIGSPRAASAAAKTAAAAGEDAARAWPMPTDWEPWPGRRRRSIDIVRSVAATDWRRRPIRVHACTDERASPVTPVRPAVPRRGVPSRVASRRTCRRRSWRPAPGSPTSARSASASRWAARSGASSSSGSPASSATCGSGFTQLAALYVLADGTTLTVGELAEAINRSPSATSRLIDGLVRRRLVERQPEEEDRRQRILRLTPRGHAILRVVDRARAEQFLGAVRPLPTAERAIVAMGVAALATHAISRRGRLIRGNREPGT